MKSVKYKITEMNDFLAQQLPPPLPSLPKQMDVVVENAKSYLCSELYYKPF